MRKGARGLVALAQEQMGCDPFSGSVFLFCGRDRRLLKAVWWDRTGFWLSQKRLERDKFPWPDTAEAARELSAEQARMLLAGIDFFKEHQPLQCRQVS
jgi:transposase